jgi:hypothetical protein
VPSRSQDHSATGRIKSIKKKSQKTASGIGPATFRFVAHRILFVRLYRTQYIVVKSVWICRQKWTVAGEHGDWCDNDKEHVELWALEIQQMCLEFRSKLRAKTRHNRVDQNRGIYRPGHFLTSPWQRWPFADEVSVRTDVWYERRLVTRATLFDLCTSVPAVCKTGGPSCSRAWCCSCGTSSVENARVPITFVYQNKISRFAPQKGRQQRCNWVSLNLEEPIINLAKKTFQVQFNVLPLFLSATHSCFCNTRTHRVDW